MIDERPAEVETRQVAGHWEIDTVMGAASEKPCIVTLVERTSGYVLIGKLPNRTTKALNRRTIGLMQDTRAPFRTITSDNGTEFHGYLHIEAATGATAYFARPYHPWERGTNENTNGLIRQYLPKGAEHGAPDPTTMQRHRSRAQHQTEETTWLRNTTATAIRSLRVVALGG